MKKTFILITTFLLSLGVSISACDLGVQDADPSSSLRDSLLPLCTEGDRRCTYTMGWYKNHTDFPGDWPIDPQTELCGMTLVDILKTPPAGDHWLVLSHQWITATLNAIAGAPVDAQTWDALVSAESVILSCEVSDVAQASAWTETLDSFNNGELLAPHCDDL